MKRLQYEQMICCSSQKSIVTGQAGFGIRSKSAGISDKVAEDLFGKMDLRYDLPMSARANGAFVTEHQQLDRFYPNVYVYKKVTLSDGQTKYIIGRVMYIAADYGFFVGLPANRVGSNYLAHVLVFDQDPGVDGAASALNQDVFLPSNTLVSNANAELMSMLVGDPVALPGGVLAIDEPTGEPLAEESAWLAVALMQAYKNEWDNKQAKAQVDKDVNGKPAAFIPEKPSRVIFKAKKDDMGMILASLADMPTAITDKCYFVGNATNSTGVPDQIKMITVNECSKGETEDRNYVVVSLLGGIPQKTNVDDNPLFKHYIDACAAENAKHANDIADLYISLVDKKDVDYEFLYRLLVLTTTAAPVGKDDLRPEMIKKIITAQLPDDKKAIIRQKVNMALDSALGNASDAVMALEAVDAVHATMPGYLSLQPMTLNNVVSILFYDTQRFARVISNESALSGALLLISKMVPGFVDEGNFFGTLLTTPSVDIWRKFLTVYYGNMQQVSHKADEVLPWILGSSLPQRASLALSLYPMDQYFGQWEILLNNRPEFAPLVKNDLDAYLRQCIKSRPIETMQRIFTYVPQLQSQMDIIGFAHLMADMIEDSQKNTLNYQTLAEVYNQLVGRGIPVPTVERLLCIKHEQPISNVGVKDLKVAKEIGASENYRDMMYVEWVKLEPEASDIAKYISTNANSPQRAAKMYDDIWTCMSHGKRAEVLQKVSDNCSWKEFGEKEILGSMTEKEAVDFLTQGSGFFKKMGRKIKGIFGALATLVVVSALASCSHEAKEASSVQQMLYTTPYIAQEYGYGPDVFYVKESEYGSTGALINIYEKYFNPYGQLISESKYNTSGGKDVINYIYDDEGALVDINSTDNSTYTISYNSDDQVELIEQVLPNGKTRVEKHFTYLGGLPSEVIESQNGKEVSHTYYYYWDAEGNMKEKTVEKNNETTTTSYDQDGSIASVSKYKNGKLSSQKNYRHGALHGSYDQDGNLKNDKQIDFVNTSGQTKGYYKVEYYPWSENLLAAYNEQNDTNYGLGSASALANSESGHNGHESNVAAASAGFHGIGGGYVAPMQNKWILWVVLGLTVLFAIWFFIMTGEMGWFRRFVGYPDSKTGMKRLWMFNKEPYIDSALVLGILLCAFVAAVITVLLIGGIVWLLLWLVKLLIIALIFVGILALIVGALALFFSDEKGYGCGGVLFGGVIAIFKKPLSNFGEACVDAGLRFWNSVNVFDWTISLFRDHWRDMLLAFGIPVALFAGFAILVIVLVMLLMLIEKITMKIYGIRRPCPNSACGYSGEMDYYVDKAHKHPVSLSPGVYGVFSHSDPSSIDKLPTMLINGKGSVLRRCPECGTFIDNSGGISTVGTESHIGFIGHRSSGKSYLLYSVLGAIEKILPGRVSQVDSDADTNIKDNLKRIKGNDDIQTDVRDAYRAVQITISPVNRPVGYHLFFYDVAGEKFNQNAAALKSGMKFYESVKQVYFVIDPAMIDYTGNPPSPQIEEWLEKQPEGEKFSLSGVLSSFKSIIEQAHRKLSDIKCTFVLVKADQGYLEAVGLNANDMNSDDVKAFISNHLMLSNIINSVSGKGGFKSVDFAVESVAPQYKDHLYKFANQVLEALGVD